MCQSSVFQYKTFLFKVRRHGAYHRTEIHDLNGLHLWTVTVVMTGDPPRWDLADAAIEAMRQMKSQITP